MIELDSETVFRLSMAPKFLPPGRGGRPIHVATVFRWAQRGVRGIKLETAQLGGAKVTSLQALQRFIQRLTALEGDEATAAATDRRARRRAAAAMAELEREGF